MPVGKHKELETSPSTATLELDLFAPSVRLVTSAARRTARSCAAQVRSCAAQVRCALHHAPGAHYVTGDTQVMGDVTCHVGDIGRRMGSGFRPHRIN